MAEINRRRPRPSTYSGRMIGPGKLPIEQGFSPLAGRLPPEVKLHEVPDIIRDNPVQVTQADTVTDDDLDIYLAERSGNPEMSEVQLYFKEIIQYRMISAEEEVLLGRTIQSGIRAQEELAALTPEEADRNPEKTEELNRLVLLGKKAVEEFTNANLRLVISVAKEYLHRGLPFLDLIQEGNIGLTKAVHRFNPELGNKFSTFAINWIRQAISRAVLDKGNIIHIPVHQQPVINSIRNIFHERDDRGETRPSIDELAVQLDTTPDDILMLMSTVVLAPVHLEDKISLDDSEAERQDFIPDTRDEYEELDEELICQYVRNLVETCTLLDARERSILELRFGFKVDPRLQPGPHDGPPTLETLSTIFGVERERIRQIEERAINKLRSHGLFTRLHQDIQGRRYEPSSRK